MEKVDIKTLHGHLFTCESCNKFHFEYNQFGIDFPSLNSIENFRDYLSRINPDDFERANKETRYKRKIHIPFPNTAIKMLLAAIEIKELKVLLSTFIEEYKIAEEENKAIKYLSKLSNNQLN
ncbi:DUF6686 family protein [Plebeiibacterium marinum]|uniref:Uncharacterized protein n=1 Tax=Plebeiibacterium marinum TaxID=2992111 RepID=A0AAE3SIB3_9BACT|nr:DUF6686 family protein [Plebeiobacterium marinum]MCW3804278.1 hypothetical protein [Plebeiobacterium marinum]